MRRFFAVLVLVAAAAACGSLEDEPGGADDDDVVATPEITPSPAPFAAWCQVDVVGVGTLDMEDDYLPHVIQCENDGAGPEALRAQAISARSYAYYKIGVDGSVTDGQGDQVYSCNKTPEPRHYDAARDTAGQFYMYEDTVVAAFYVAGANPSDRATCIATSADPDPTNTEKYVTYNEGLSGDDVEQTTLGWVHPDNWANRGCMSQWGSRCLDDAGYGFDAIGRFYYGLDIVRVKASGPCVDGRSDALLRSPPVLRPPPGAQTHRWGPALRIGAR